MDSGCGAVDRVIAFDTREPLFELHIHQKFIDHDSHVHSKDETVE